MYLHIALFYVQRSDVSVSHFSVSVIFLVAFGNVNNVLCNFAHNSFTINERWKISRIYLKAATPG